MNTNKRIKRFLMVGIGVATAVSLYGFTPDRMRIYAEFPGDGYTVKKSNLLNGRPFFTNRTYVLQGVPSEFMGFEMLVSGGKEQLPVTITATGTGEVYLVSGRGRSFEGWTELTRFQDMSYSDKTNTPLSIYARAAIAGEKIVVPLITDFEGTTVLARAISEDGGPVVRVRGKLLDLATVDKEAFMYLKNSSFKMTSVPSEFIGLSFTRPFPDVHGKTEFSVDREAEVFLIAHSATVVPDGWERLSYSFPAGGSKIFYIYRRVCMPTEGWIAVPDGTLNSLLMFSGFELEGFDPAPGTVITRSLDQKNVFIANPSIAVLPDGAYVATCTGAFRVSGDKARASVFRSDDRGKTWRVLCPNTYVMSFANLFVHRGDLYYMGTAGSYKDVVIRKSTDGGYTWTEPVSSETGILLTNGFYHSAPVPVIACNGRLWRGMEKSSDNKGKNKQAMILSCPVDADIMNAANWTCSNALSYEESWIDENGGDFGDWLEGNAVPAPDGGVALMMRVDDTVNGDKAACIRVSADGKTISFDPENDIIRFPGGGKKFTIRYDEESAKYWTLTNTVFEDDRGKEHCGLLRNRVTLVCSDDLRNWEIRDTVISHDDPHFHGYQYWDWQFDGNDIIAVSRTASESETGLPVRQHDANYLTFHRIKNFRLSGLSVCNPSGEEPVFQVYPTQVADRIFVRTRSSSTFTTLYDLYGRKCFSRVIEGKGEHMLPLTVSDGLYVLELTDRETGRRQTVKIVISK